MIKKVTGIALIVLSSFGFFVFIEYLIFEHRGYGDNGLGSYAVWASGMVGLILGLLFLAIGIILIQSNRKKKKQ